MSVGTSLKTVTSVEEEDYFSGAAGDWVTGRKVWIKVETQGEVHLMRYEDTYIDVLGLTDSDRHDSVYPSGPH